MREITDGSAKFRVVDKRLKAMIDMLYPVGIVVTTATDDALKPGEEDRLAQWEEIAQARSEQTAASAHNRIDNIYKVAGLISTIISVVIALIGRAV